jgi:CTP:molybdopterin cytidylyltransferase MocA
MTRTVRLGAVILAAGESRRFRSTKQVACLAGVPLLEWAIRNAAAADLARMVVVLGAHEGEVRTSIDFGPAEVVANERWAEGPGTSLARGLAELADCSTAVVLLGDQPFVGPLAIERVVAVRLPGVVALRATYGGNPAHPVVLERAVWREATATAGHGARAVFARADTREVECGDLADAVDVDTTADLDALATGDVRARLGGGSNWAGGGCA